MYFPSGGDYSQFFQLLVVFQSIWGNVPEAAMINGPGKRKHKGIKQNM